MIRGLKTHKLDLKFELVIPNYYRMVLVLLTHARTQMHEQRGLEALKKIALVILFYGSLSGLV